MMRPEDVRALAVIGLLAAAGLAFAPVRAEGGPAPLAGPGWDAALTRARAIDVNLADAAELERLPGIGPALAERIIADRAQRGRFGAADDLARVRGLGPATIEKIEKYLIFE